MNTRLPDCEQSSRVPSAADISCTSIGNDGSKGIDVDFDGPIRDLHLEFQSFSEDPVTKDEAAVSVNGHSPAAFIGKAPLRLELGPLILQLEQSELVE